MNDKLIIGILIAIIIVLIIGVIAVMPNMQKQESKIAMASSNSLTENDSRFEWKSYFKFINSDGIQRPKRQYNQ